MFNAANSEKKGQSSFLRSELGGLRKGVTKGGTKRGSPFKVLPFEKKLSFTEKINLYKNKNRYFCTK